jgi:hypothetical protein
MCSAVTSALTRFLRERKATNQSKGRTHGDVAALESPLLDSTHTRGMLPTLPLLVLVVSCAAVEFEHVQHSCNSSSEFGDRQARIAMRQPFIVNDPQPVQYIMHTHNFADGISETAWYLDGNDMFENELRGAIYKRLRGVSPYPQQSKPLYMDIGGNVGTHMLAAVVDVFFHVASRRRACCVYCGAWH